MSYDTPPEYPPVRIWTGRVDPESVVPNPEQPRSEFDPVALGRLTASMEELQIQPVIVMPYTDPARPWVRWMIVDGERRWRGIRYIKRDSIVVCYLPGVTAQNIHEKSFAANFCREGHTHQETARAIDKQRQAGKSYDAIGLMVGKSGAWVQMEHKVLQLAPELMPLVDNKDKKNRMAMRVANLLADLPPDQQRTRWRGLQGTTTAAQVTKLRFSGDVKLASTGSRGRSRDDDTCYRGQLTTVLRTATTAANVPRAMLKSLRPDSVQALKRTLDDIQEQVVALRRRLEELGHE